MKPERKDNDKVLLVGFPSNGLIGTFSISYLIHNLKMKQIGEIEHSGLPAAFFIENGEIFAPIRIYKKDNLHVILSDLPQNQELFYEFAESILDFSKKNNIGKMIVISGTEPITSKPSHKVHGLVTHQSLEALLYENKIPKFLSGTIFGNDAVLISVFRRSKIPALFLYAECHPFFPDPEASIHAITTLSKILKIKLDTSDIQKKVEHLRIQHRDLMQETTNALKKQDEMRSPPRAPQIYK